MNNKGFAISTMLYGLLIVAVLMIFMILSLISFNKKSSSDFVNQVEQELINLANSKNSTYCN